MSTPRQVSIGADDIGSFLAAVPRRGRRRVHPRRRSGWRTRGPRRRRRHPTPRCAAPKPNPGNPLARDAQAHRPRPDLHGRRVGRCPLPSCERGGCTVLLDEVDTVFGPKAHDREDLRGLLDAGYATSPSVPDVSATGRTSKSACSTCSLPSAFRRAREAPPHPRDPLDRGAHEATHRQRTNRAATSPEGAPCRRGVAPPVRGVGGSRCTSAREKREAAVPEELSDRAQDVWEPLVAIADMAGEGWAERARAAAVDLYAARDQDGESIGRRLLADVRAVFDDPERDDPVNETDGPTIASGALRPRSLRLRARRGRSGAGTTNRSPRRRSSGSSSRSASDPTSTRSAGRRSAAAAVVRRRGGAAQRRCLPCWKATRSKIGTARGRCVARRRRNLSTRSLRSGPSSAGGGGTAGCACGR